MANTPLFGVCYSPTWTGWSPPYSNSGANAQFSDADFFNDSFPALWNTGTDTDAHAYRDDLGTLADGGFTLLRLYNWGPTRGWNGTVGTAHLSFLDYAASKGIKVVVPISNYFLSDDTYAWNGTDPGSDYSLGSAPAAIRSALAQFLGSVTDPATRRLHAAVHSFSVGNEIDINTLVGQGSSGVVEPASRLARVLWWFVNLQGQMTADSLGKALLTSPISNADQGNPGPTPFSYWFGAFVDGVTSGITPLPQGTTGGSASTFSGSWSGLSGYAWYEDWYYNSVNIYQTGTGLAATLGQYDAWSAQTLNNQNWPGQQFAVPLMLTEIGVQRGSPTNATTEQTQFTAVTQGIAQTIKTYLAGTTSSLLSGYCIYEFSDEPSLNANWGMFTVGATQYTEATGSTVVSYATWPSTNYPVESLAAVTDSSGATLIDALKAIFTASSSGGATREEIARAVSVAEPDAERVG